ncbi:hypothetical protein ACEWY4_005536 [Coilia grayii]|uniref:PDZ domain-containing protein n=1 Tax=Coilia grayii TaxID=363190 RepID=A0ABD1KIM2_9TELE
MSEDLENGDSGVLVQTAKEACAEGLVVTGGGKDGIFIKELKPDSPASKHLRVKEGDQILSATVYFDNVSYEDALQILEHAQAYKMEFCLKRKPQEATVQEDAETERPEGEGGSPKMRGRKPKRQDARISWPKFPSFSKGRKGFKRSHSTSEAEEQRKLEMSPTTSDTESPVKSPLKSPDGKEKKKKRLKLKVKMKGLRSKSVEHPSRDDEPTMEILEGVENQVDQNGTDIQSPEEMQLLGEPQVVEQEEAERQESNKGVNEYTFPSLTGPEMETGLHKVELITLDKTLKTTDISAALAESSQKDQSSPESVKTMERSELRVHIQGKDLLDTVKESQTKSSLVSQMDQSTSIRTSDASTYDNVVISQSDFSDHQLHMDINTQATNQGKKEKITGHGEMDMSMPKVDVSLDMSDIGLLRKSPRIGGEKQWKDRTMNIPEPESYGIRTRGPLADMATSKTTFDSLNGIQFSGGASATSAMETDSDLKFAFPKAVISQPTSCSLDISVTDKSKDGKTDIKVPYVSGSPVETSIGKVLADLSTTDSKVKAELKLPKVGISDSSLSEQVKMTKVDSTRPQLPNREELEIPGMEDAASTAALQIQQMKLPQIDEKDDTTLTDEIKTKRSEIEFNLEDVKALVAKIPTFKLPRIDMSGIYTHKEITPDSDKIVATSETSPPELSEAKTDVSLKLPDDTVEVMATPTIDIQHRDPSASIKLPNVELPHLDDQEPITVTRVGGSKTKAKLITGEVKSVTDVGKSVEIKYKLPKREDIEIPGMEAIEKTTVQMPHVKPVLEVKEIQKPDTSVSHSTDGQFQIPLPAAAVDMKGTALIIHGKTERPPTDKKDKKSKKTKKSMPSLGITKPDIRFPDTGIDLPKQITSQVTVDTKIISPVDDIKIKTQKPSVDIQKPEMAIKDMSIKGEIDTSKLKDEGEIYKQKVDIPAPGVKVHEEGISLIDMKETGTVVMDMTKVDISLSQTEARVDVPSTDIESQVNIPEVDIDVKSPVGEVEVPETDTKLKKRKISFPKFSFSRSEVKASDVNITSPKHTEIDPTAPESDTPSKDKNISPTKFKLPTLKFPKFGMSSQHASIDEETAVKMPEDEILEVKLPAHDLSVTETLPTGDQTIASVDIAVPDSDTVGKIEGPKSPSTKTEGPELNLSISKPEIEIPSTDVSITPAKDLKTKESEIEPPGMEIKTQEGKSFKLPKFGITMPKITGPDIDITIKKTQADTSLPEGKVDIEQPDASSVKAVTDVPDVDVELPSVDVKDATAATDVSVEVEAKEGDAKLKKRRISFPRFGFSRSESKGSDMDAEISKGETTTASADIKETDIKTLEGEAASKDKGSSPTKFKLPTLKFPKFGMSPPKVQTEGIDVDVVKTIPEEEILEVTVQQHDIATKELELTSSANIDVPIIDVEAKAEVPQIKMETHELDTKNVEGSKFKMPKFGISLPKVKGPEISMSVTKPEVEISVPEEKNDLKSADVEITMPSSDAESKEADIKFTMPKMSFPKFGITKSQVMATEIDAAPKVDITLSDGEGKIKGDLEPQGNMEVTSPKAELKVDLKEPDLDIKAPDVELKDSTALSSSPSKFKLPSFKLPKFGVSAPKVKVGTADLTVDVKSPDVKLTGVEIETPKAVSSDVKTPSIDLSVSTNLPEPEISMPKVDIDGKQPHVDIDAKVPDMPDMKASSLHIDPPEANISLSGKGPSFTSDIVLPSVDVLKESDVTVQPGGILPPEGKLEFKLPKVEGPALEGDTEITEMNIKGPDGGQFKMPKFGISLPKVKVPDITMSVSKQDADVSVPEAKAEVNVPDSEITGPSIDTELPQADAKDFDAKMKKRKISFPKFGFSKPEVKAPEVDVTLPKVDVSLSGGEIKEPKIDVKIAEESEIKVASEMGSPTKFKLPTFKLPKIGVSASKGVPELPEVDTQAPDAELKISENVPILDGVERGLEVEIPSIDGDVSLPEGKVDVEATLPQGKVEMPVVDVKMKRPGFTFPKFGLSKAEAKAPEVDIPEGRVEVTQPDLDVKIPEGEVKLKDASITSPTKFKLPTIKFPKIGISASRETAEVPTADVDIKAPEVSLGDANLTISGDMPVVDVEGPRIDIKVPDAEADAESQGSKQKLPKFGISLPKVKGPEVDVSVPKTDVDISLPGVKTDIEIPSVEGKGELPDASLKDTDIKAKKPGFSFPKFGFSKPEVKDAELDVSLPKIDISAKGEKSEVKVPEVDANIPEGSIETKDSKGIDIKVKRPSFSFPKFGLSKPNIKTSDIDANIPEVDMSLPEGKVDVRGPEIDVKIPEGEIEHKDANIYTSPTKFKLPTIKFPKIGVSAPKGSVDAPSLDIDVKAPEVHLPDAEVKVSAEVPQVDLKGQNVDAQLPSIDVSAGIEGPEGDGQPSKFKLPNFGISLPKVKGPEFDISVTKPELDTSLPEGKVDVDVPLPDGKADITGPDSKGADVKIKRPSFSFPKFGLSKPDVKVPDVDVNLPEVDMSLPEGKVEVKGPEIDVKIAEGDAQHKDTTIHTSPTKFKLPTFKLPRIGMAAPKVSVEAPGLDVDVKGPEMSLPDAELSVSGEIPEVDIKGQNVDVELPSADVSLAVEGHERDGSKLKLPKFGISLPKVKGPEFDTSVEKPDLDVSLPKEKVDIDASLPELKIETPQVDSKGIDVKIKKPSFSFPKFGSSKPDVKAPDMDVNLPEVDISLPKGKMEIKGPEAEAKIPDTNIHTSPTKFKLPTFKLPKIGVSTSKESMEAPSLDIKVKASEVNLPDAELKVSGEVPELDLKGQDVDLQPPSIDIDVHAEGPEVQGSKLKFPKFGISLPKVKGPELDASVSKPDLDIPLPEGKVDVEACLAEGTKDISGVDSEGIDIKMKRTGFSLPKFGLPKSDIKAPEVDASLPKVDISLPEGKVEVKEASEGDVQLKDASVITSPTKFKLPTFKFPKIGVSAPKGEVDVDVKAPDVNVTDTELKVSIDVPTADVKGQAVDVEAPSAQVKAEIPEADAKGLDVKMKRSSFSFPKFGISKAAIKAPDVDVNLPEADVSLPEGAIEVKDSAVNVQVAENEVELKDANISGSPSKFKLPTIKLPKFGITVPKVTIETENLDASITRPDLSVPEGDVSGEVSSVVITAPNVDIKTTTADADIKTKGADTEGQVSKFKLPQFGIGLPKVKGSEVTVTKPESDITLPEGEVEMKVDSADVEISSATVKVDLPEVDSKDIAVDIKKSSFSFPKFGFSKPDAKTPEIDTTLPKADISLPEGNQEEPKLDSEVEAEVKDATISGSPSKFKLPTIKFPKFGVTVPKVEAQESDVQVREQDVPDNELKVSGEPVSIDIQISTQECDVDVQTVGLGTEGQGSKFKLPKFGVSLPKVKGPEGEGSLPEGKLELEGAIKGSSVEAQTDMPEVDVSAKTPGFSFPKFGFAKPEVKSSEIDVKTPQAHLSKPEVTVQVQDAALDIKSPDKERAISSPTKFKLPAFKLPSFGGSPVKSTMEVTVDSSLSQGAAELKTVDTDIKDSASGETVDLDKSDINVEVKPKISFPKFSFSKPAVKAPEVDVTLASADVTLPEQSIEADINVRVPEAESKGETVTAGSPSKFKLPTIKLPKFGTTPKTTIEAEVTVPEVDSSLAVTGSETDIPAVEETVASGNEVSTPTGDSKVIGSPSKFKLPTFKMPKLSLSRTKSEEDAKTPSDVKPQDSPLETGDKDSTQVTDTSPKFTLPTVQDVLRSFDVEFNVPTLDGTDETKGGASQPGEGEVRPAVSGVKQDGEASTDVQEKSKFALTFSTQGLSLTSKDSDKVAKTDVTITKCTKEEQTLELQTQQKLQDTKDTISEKGSWFKFPKFPSPTKSVKLTERETGKPSEDHEQNIESDNLETDISLTSSVRSSDAFADESSAPTTEQIVTSLTSPTRVTVKYAEPVSTGTGDVTAKIITSTARTELISMEPDLPEKVNISFSSDSSSMDTLKQESGAFHIITSNVQTIPDTQQAKLLTDLETQALQSLPLEQVIIKTTSTPWSVQETSTMQEGSIVVEKRVIKEMSGESMETVIIKQKTCTFEPISSAAASSSQMLRDIVHTEKMRFFEGREMPEENTVVTSVTTERRVVKHSTEEHHEE